MTDKKRSEDMSQLKQDTNNGVTRRDLLRSAGVAAGGLVLAACGQTPSAAPTATKGSTGAAAAAATATPAAAGSSGGKTLTLAIQGFAHDAIRPILDQWEEQTGNTVELESGPTTGQEMVTKYAPAFQSESSPVDVISDADDSGPIFYRAGWIEPLDDVVPEETWNDFPDIFDEQIETWHSYNGHRYRVPHEFAIGYNWYRQDWFEEQGANPPETWEDFVSIGKEFTNPPVYGTLEAIKKPGLTYVYMAYLCSQSGGDIFSFDEGTATAFQFAYDLIYEHEIMPESALSMDYSTQNEEYMNDHVAMMRQWPFFWDVARGNDEWYEQGKAKIMLPPAGQAGAKSWWGGWGFSVPKFAPNKEEALDLVRFITSVENAPTLAENNSWFIMPRNSIIDAMSENAFVQEMQRYVDEGVPAPRPFHPKISEAQSVVDDVASLFLTNQISLDEALQQGKQRIDELGE